ncbi:hypothetical protein EBU71_12440 [bacterium]|nr:hypothetical protein [Candidatus Elulimicrobium humile]
MATLFIFLAGISSISNLKGKNTLPLNISNTLDQMELWSKIGFGLCLLSIFGYFSFAPKASQHIREPYLSGLRGLVIVLELFLIGLGIYITYNVLNISTDIAHIWVIPLMWLFTLSAESALVWSYFSMKRRTKEMGEAFQQVRDIYNRLKGRVIEA